MPVLIIRFDGDVPTGISDQYLLSSIPSFELYSSDSATASETYSIAWIYYQTDLSTSIDVLSIVSNHISAGLALVDSAQGVETDLIINLGYDVYAAQESFIEQKSPHEPSYINSLDPPPIASDTDLRIFLNSDLPEEEDIYIVLNSIIMTELYSELESYLIIRLDTQLPISSESDIRIFLNGNLATELDLQYIESTITDSFVTDAASAQETDLIIILSIDSATEIDYSNTVIYVPPQSLTSLTDVYWSILQIFINSGLFTSADYVIELDSLVNWPAGSPPFVLLEPKAMRDISNAVGAGRFGKVYEVEITAHVISMNISDISYKDTNILISTNPLVGPISLTDKIVNLVEQSYPLNINNQPTLIELPYFTDLGIPRRYGNSNEYLGTQLTFKCTFQQLLPLNMLAVTGLSNVLKGTFQVSYNSNSVVSSSATSGLIIGMQIFFIGDQSGQVYAVTAGSGDSWVISPAYGGLNNLAIYADVFIPLTDIYYSILQTVKNSNFFTTTDYAIDPDSVSNWPISSFPFAIIEPRGIHDDSNAVGAGRFGKTYEINVCVHIIIGNTFDISWRDTNVMTSTSLLTGPIALADQLLNYFEQSWPVNALNIPTLIELPYCTSIDPPRRYGKSNEYIGIPVNFKMNFQQGLYAVLP